MSTRCSWFRISVNPAVSIKPGTKLLSYNWNILFFMTILYHFQTLKLLPFYWKFLVCLLADQTPFFKCTYLKIKCLLTSVSKPDWEVIFFLHSVQTFKILPQFFLLWIEGKFNSQFLLIECLSTDGVQHVCLSLEAIVFKKLMMLINFVLFPNPYLNYNEKVWIYLFDLMRKLCNFY